jgi:adenylosuccinate synthase
MPTELNDEVGEAIRVKAHEFGTTTGRPRRCGWFDGVAARFSSQLNGFTGGIITRIDVLDELPKLKICTAYELDGKIIDYIPASVSEYDRCKPVYEELDGWQTTTSHIRKYQDLPVQARKYIKRMEDFMDCPFNFACIGPTREQTIPLNSVFLNLF